MTSPMEELGKHMADRLLCELEARGGDIRHIAMLQASSVLYGQVAGLLISYQNRQQEALRRSCAGETEAIDIAAIECFRGVDEEDDAIDLAEIESIRSNRVLPCVF